LAVLLEVVRTRTAFGRLVVGVEELTGDREAAAALLGASVSGVSFFVVVT
jgi:ribose/xylose/arabinose/galactoside ABC-type transport system permease subunit